MLAVWISDPLISSSQGCPCCLHYLGFTIRQLYFQHLFFLSNATSPHIQYDHMHQMKSCAVYFGVGSKGRKGGRDTKCHVQSFALSTSANSTSENDRGSVRLQIISINVLKKWLCRVGRKYILTGNEEKGTRDKINKSWSLGAVGWYWTSVQGCGHRAVPSHRMMTNWREFRRRQQKWLMSWMDWFMRKG